MTTNKQKNELFPVFVKLNQLHVLVVGGGNVALEKLTAIWNSSPNTKVTLVADKIKPEILALQSDNNHLLIKEKLFDENDFEGVDIVVVAVGNIEFSEHIRKEAKIHRLLVNVADKPELCDFYLGSIVTKGELKIAISTNGKSPS